MKVRLLILFAAALASTAFAELAPTNWSAIACSADGFKIIGTISGSASGNRLPGPIYTTTNSGLNWASTTAPLLRWTAVACSADGLILTAGGTEYGEPIYRSTNSGVTWFPTGSPTTNQWNSLAGSANGQVLVASYPQGGHVPGGVFTSTNGGTSWDQVLHDYYSWQSVSCSADGQIMVAVATFTSVGLFRSIDSGLTWTATNGPVGDWLYCAKLSADGSKLITAGFDGHIYSSTNLGDNWQEISPATGSRALVACSADARTIIAAYGIYDPYNVVPPGPLYYSTDGGLSWVGGLGLAANWSAVACSADGHRLFAADFNGVVSVIQLKPADLQLTMPPPRLDIFSAGNDVVADWLVPSRTFVLQETTNLISPIWTGVATNPSINNTNIHYQVSFPKWSGAKFFRLTTP